MDRDKLLGLAARIKHSPDGPELIDYLKELSRNNYEAFKRDAHGNDTFHKGYAVAIDSLIALFENHTQPQADPMKDLRWA